MPIPAGRLTRGTILDQALQRVGNRKIKAQAREQLDQILDELALDYDWPFLFREAAVTLSGSAFSLPTDSGEEFLKSQDDEGLVVTSIQGQLVHHRVFEVPPETWQQSAIPSDATAAAPRIWTVLRSGTTAKIWPTPDTPVPATLRYKFRPARVDPSDTATFDANIPWFPWHRLLIDMVAQWGMEWDKDPRARDEWLAIWGDHTAIPGGGKLQRIRAAAIPPRAELDQLPLDPLLFRTPLRIDGS